MQQPSSGGPGRAPPPTPWPTGHAVTGCRGGTGQAVREAESLRRRAEGLVGREELHAAQARVRHLEVDAAARRAAAADMAPAAALAAARDEARRLRDACARLEDAARRAAADAAAVAAARGEAVGARVEARELRERLEGAVPRAAAEAVAAQVEGLATEVAWLRRLVTSMAQVPLPLAARTRLCHSSALSLAVRMPVNTLHVRTRDRDGDRAWAREQGACQRAWDCVHACVSRARARARAHRTTTPVR
jgi:hypothetical protein